MPGLAKNMTQVVDLVSVYFQYGKLLLENHQPQFPKKKKEKYSDILKKVKVILDDQDMIQNIMNCYDKENESLSEYKINRRERIIKVLNLAGLNTDEDYELYKSALEMSKSGYSIILERDIDELFVNSYNPEWSRAWNGNLDVQICLDYYAVITYITEYFTKGDSGLMILLIEALKKIQYGSIQDKMKHLVNAYISAR